MEPPTYMQFLHVLKGFLTVEASCIVQRDLRQSCNIIFFGQFLKSWNEDLTEKLPKLGEKKKIKLLQDCLNYIFNPSALFVFLLTCDT